MRLLQTYCRLLAAPLQGEEGTGQDFMKQTSRQKQ
jgi:hypothetical protein